MFKCLNLVSRVVIIENNHVLLVKHVENNKSAWIFPGGRVEVGESVSNAAIRECKEETGYDVDLIGICYMQEYDIYYVTYFYSKIVGGALILGKDPELSDEKQVLKEIKWINIDSLDNYEIYPKGLVKLLKKENFYKNIITIPEIS